ncbi:MAG: hypothetical protein QXU32_13125 [Nitrososphaerales archaeon]
MHLVHNRKLVLITLAVAIAFTSLILVKIFYEVIVLLFPQLIELTGPPPIAAEPPPNTPSLVFAMFYNLSPYFVSIAWALFLLTLWRGKHRKVWMQKGYGYDAFKIFTKMRGSDTRVKILRNLQIPKNRLQLAKELDMHWKSIDSHVDLLIKYGLAKEVITFGTAKYLIITDKGKEVLELLENSKEETD